MLSVPVTPHIQLSDIQRTNLVNELSVGRLSDDAEVWVDIMVEIDDDLERIDALELDVVDTKVPEVQPVVEMVEDDEVEVTVIRRVLDEMPLLQYDETDEAELEDDEVDEVDTDIVDDETDELLDKHTLLVQVIVTLDEIEETRITDKLDTLEALITIDEPEDEVAVFTEIDEMEVRHNVLMVELVDGVSDEMVELVELVEKAVLIDTDVADETDEILCIELDELDEPRLERENVIQDVVEIDEVLFDDNIDQSFLEDAYIIVVYAESEEADEREVDEPARYGVVVIEIDELEVVDETELMLNYFMKH